MRTDILLDADFDLIILDNDLTLDVSDNQHAKLLLSTNQGDWTQFPKIGVGLIQYLKGQFDGAGRRNVRLQFESDGYRINTFDFDPQTGQTNLDFS